MIETTLRDSPPIAYDQDYHLWLLQAIEQLEHKNWQSLDVENLIEEIKGLAKRDKRAIASYLRLICEHLLKLKYWTKELERCSRGWRREIINFRSEMGQILQDSPSLHSYLDAVFTDSYRSARQSFLEVSGVDENVVPEQPPFSITKILDQHYFG